MESLSNKEIFHSKKHYNFFKKSILSFAFVPDELIDKLFEITSLHHFPKGKSFLKAGEISDFVGFNLNGIFRLYYVDSEGNDFTKSFSIPGKFVISYTALVQKRPSLFYIDAVAKSDLLRFRYSEWKKMIENDIRWYPFIFKLIESVYVMKEMREKSFLIDDAKTRYIEFRKMYPQLEGMVRQYQIASFLGMTPETLSRIRNELKLT